MKAVKHVSFNDVKEMTLLTTEQAERLPDELLSCGEWWWLRSPGSYHDCAAGVSLDGFINCNGYYVHYGGDCVRPAFVIPGLDSKIYDKVHIGGYRYTLDGNYIGGCLCTVIDKDLVLADDVVCRHRFDLKSNDWDKSELKGYINSNEFLKMLEGGKNNE